MALALNQIEPPVRVRPDTPMTDDEFLQFCAANEPMRFEREPDGEILVTLPCGNRTGRTNAYIVYALGEWSQADGRGYYFDSSTGFTLPDNSMRSPDAAWVLASRWDALSEEEKDRFSHIAPDFVIELRSHSDRLSGLRSKMEQWIANGVQIAWLIDPIERAVTVYRSGAEPEYYSHPSSVQGAGPIAGFELVFARVWG
jgi:Uma2 family endonuclease